MKRMCPLLTTPVIVFFFMSLTSIAQVRPKNDKPAQPGVEVPALRDAYAKHYRQADGTMQAVICAGRVHYQDDKGRWQDIHTQLTPSNAPGMAYENTTNAITSAFPINGGAPRGVVIDAGDGLSLQMGMELKLEAFAVDGSFLGVIENASSSNATAGNAANAVEYPGVFSNATNTYEVHRAKVKNNLILNSPIANVPAFTAYVGFSEVISLPTDIEVIANGEVVLRTTFTSRAIQFISANSDESLQIPVPEIYELNNPSACVSPMGQYDVAYRIEPLGNGRYRLTTLTPLAWLADGARNYPVVVDPTVVLSGNWGGYLKTGSYPLSQGNPYPYVIVAQNYFGDIHRGFIQWNTGSIGFATIQNTEVNLYMGAGTSYLDSIFICDVNGAYAPYGGFSSAVYADLGDGDYYHFSCGLQWNYYGYFDLGADADNDVLGNLYQGKFQVGLKMDPNAPQDHWKIFESNTSYLRITYEPCTSPIAVSLTGSENSFGYALDCHADSTATIMTSASGGGSSYQYVWSDTAASFLDSNQNLSGLGAGMYVITVYSGSLCPAVDTIVLNAPPALVLDDSISTFVGGKNVSCFGASDAEVYPNASGGSGAYSYVWAGPGGSSATTQNITGLTAGTYHLTLTDASDCLLTDSFVLTQPNELLSSINTHTDAFCEGDSNGSAQVSTAGGTTPYAYAWSDNISATNSANGLASATTYVVTVSDANGCEDTAMVSIGFVHPKPLVDLGPADTGLCAGGNMILNAGNSGITYLWSDASTGQLLQINALGTYAVTVATAFGCEASDTINVNTTYSLPTPSLGPNITAIGNDTLDAGAGYAAYLWNTNDTTQTYVTFLSGTYTVTVTDAHGCQGEDEVNVVIWPVGMPETRSAIDGISVYPNPADESVQVQGLERVAPNKVEVLDVLGQVVVERSGLAGTSVLIDTRNLPAGTYFLVVTKGGEESVQRMVVRH